MQPAGSSGFLPGSLRLNDAGLEQGFLPFSLSDLACLGARKDPFPAAPTSRPLEGLALHLPVPLGTGLDGRTDSAVGLIKRLGGRLATLDSATHCIVKGGMKVVDLKYSAETRQAMRHCQSMGIAVVEPSWLAAVAALPDGKDAFTVDVDPHVPPVMALLDDEDEMRDEIEIDRKAKARGVGAGSETARRASDRVGINTSLSETMSFLKKTNPEQVEEDQLQKAIERSLLDFALQLRHVGRGEPPPTEDPYAVLKIDRQASMSAIRAAYRRRALETHPDRGGHPGAFLQVQHAYGRLVEEAEAQARAGAAAGSGSATSSAGAGHAPTAGSDASNANLGVRGMAAASDGRLLTGPKVDEALADHRTLVSAWFERAGVGLSAGLVALEEATRAMGLVARDVGATNRNEQGELMYNQCFYLSLARAFLREDDGKGGEAEDGVLQSTALHFKRVVEAAVLRVHPEWADSQVGEDLQAFSDFLFYVLNGSNALLSEMAIAIFDSTSGGVEIYRGLHYPDPNGPSRSGQEGGGREGGGAAGSGGGTHSDEQRRANLLCIKYVPGHYQALVPAAGSLGPTLRELMDALEREDVRYIITDNPD